MKKSRKPQKIKAQKNITIKYYSIFKKSEAIADAVLKKSLDYQDFNEKQFKERLLFLKFEVQEKKKPLESVLIDTFALGHAAIKKVYDIALFKVQIMGAYVLHRGDVAEMRTGEGKTLTAVLPALLNCLTGKGVFIVTVNEYLSTRDAFNTGRIFELLGLTVGSILNDQKENDKKHNYSADVTYMTNSELGFDYLRDNMIRDIKQKSQREFNYAIIDEADSILIDEARTPLIISGGEALEKEFYVEANDFVKSLEDEDFLVDRETRQAFLSESGVTKAQEYFTLENLYSYKNSKLVHLITNALQANHIYKYDVDYTIKEDEVILIDNFTGRLLPGRRYSEGLNQAIEAKEAVEIQPETKVYASITYQNLFRMFKKLAGMTGTAASEEEEFYDVYNMRVLQIPTNLPIIRQDLGDIIYASKNVKYQAIVLRILEIHKTGQPILLGTRAVSESEILADLLDKEKIEFEVLNAKNHAREAEIILNAGKLNSITIATNMAGRGTDIKLGQGVKELGGLFVLGTERNEARRIDNQLRGRSGRQGDIGYSQFYISLEDEIMQRSGFKRIQKFMKSLDEEPITSRLIQKSITAAQKKIEGVNFDYRKTIIEYDDVLNSQRIITYKQRDQVLSNKTLRPLIESMFLSYAKMISGEESVSQNGHFLSELFFEIINKNFNLKIELQEKLSPNEAINIAHLQMIEKFKSKIEEWEKEKFRWNDFLRQILLMTIDLNWQDQIDKLNRLKAGIRYRQYAQKNPVQIYVQEADKIFSLYKKTILEQTINIVLNAVPNKNPYRSHPLNTTEKVKVLSVR